MTKGVQRLGGEFRSVEAVLPQPGNRLLRDWERGNGGYFGSCQQELAQSLYVKQIQTAYLII